MKIELLEGKIVLKRRHVIEINYDEIDAVALKVKNDHTRKYVLVLYLILFFFIFTKVYISLLFMSIYILLLCILLFYKFETLKAKAILFYKDKKVKLRLNDENLASTMELIEILRFNYYKKITSSAS